MSTTTAKNFDRYAADYKELLDRSISITGESGEYFAEVKVRHLSTTLGSNFGGRILDFGCGVGMPSHVLRRLLPSAKTDGFDPSEQSISAIGPELKKTGLFTSVRDHLRSDYDVIVVANVMHHIPPTERRRTVEFLSQRLSSRGRLFIFEHNPANPLTRLAVFRCPFDDDAVLLWPRETRTLVRSAGLRCERRCYLVFFPRPMNKLRPLESSLKWCPFGAQYVIEGSKP
jgi:2-polyprenyl-3-methyl-5-hydroxy-6-metoxy-1,4-benzoquinol methylase